MKVTADTYFALVPEWLLDADVSARAIQVFAVLARYADDSGSGAHPSRATLAKRCRCSVKSIDRALDELEAIGSIEVTRRFRKGGEQDSNSYFLRFEQPKKLRVAAPVVAIERGRHG
jgi:hypothetical protein